MNRPRKGRKTIILLVVGILLLGGGFGLWVLFKIAPGWFPTWFSTLFRIIAGLGALITVVGAALSDIFLPLWDRLRERRAAYLSIFADRAPIHTVTYESLIGRLGRSGQISWIDRDATSPSLFNQYGLIAIISPVKSGKTREAAELIRRAQEVGLISVVYEPILALDRIDQDVLADALAAQMEPERCLFFVDELGLRQDLTQLSTCIEAIRTVRPDAYFLITLQRERLLPAVREWLEQHGFHDVSLPSLAVEQRRKLAETGRQVLEAGVSEAGITAIVESSTTTKPWDIVSILQYAPSQDSGSAPLDEEDIAALLARSEQDIWAEQRREVETAEPSAGPL